MALITSHAAVLLLTCLPRLPAGSVQSSEACIAFGDGGMAEVSNCRDLHGVSNLPMTRDVPASWAIEIENGLALLHGDGHPSSVTLWEGNDFVRIDLGALVTPVGGAYLDGKLYIACFGSWPDPHGDSGIAVVDVAGKRLESTHSFSQGGDSRMHVHNAYVFDFKGRKEVFAAILGNPWTGPLAGRGLSMFDRSAGQFILQTTTGADLNVRSAKQQADGSIFVVTQEPNGQDTKLARLEERAGHLEVVTITTLPPRPSKGDGGADVLLGLEKDKFWVTDRQQDAPGKLYHYTYAAGSFTMVNVRDTGIVPRYTMILDNGDIVTCNQGSNTLSVYEGLAMNPTGQFEMKVISTVTAPQFFIKTANVGTMRVLV